MNKQNVKSTIGATNCHVTIRTKQMKEGIPPYWSYDDVAHIWINKDMYRVTKKGSLIKVVAEIPKGKLQPADTAASNEKVSK